MKEIIITGNDLTLEKVVAVCRGGAKVALAENARQKVLASRKVVDSLVEREAVVYGICLLYTSPSPRD